MKSRRAVQTTPIKAVAERPEISAIRQRFSRAVYDGFSYGVKFGWHQELQIAIKEKLRGHFVYEASSPYHKFWVVSEEVFEQIPDAVNYAMAAGEVAANSADFVEWLAGAERDRFAFTLGIDVKIYVLKDDGFLIKTSRYHRSFPKFLRQAGGTWMPKIKCWRYGQDVNLSLLIVEMQDYCALKPEQFDLLPGVFTLNTDIARGGREFELDLGRCLIPVSGAANPWESAMTSSMILLPEMRAYEKQIIDETAIRAFIEPLPLFDYQKENAIFMATHPGAGNFSEQGTGKTLTTIAALNAIARGKPKLIVCPANLQYNWRDEILKLFPEDSIAVITPERDAEWVVMSPGRLSLVEDWRDHFEVLVVDEAHLMKEAAADRTQGILMVAQTIPRAYVLTGTPIPNREAELYTLLRVTRHPIGLLPFEEFEERFCGTPESRAKLAMAIRPWFVRVMKLDVLDLPPKHRNRHLLEPTKAFAEIYNGIMDNEGLSGMGKIHALFRALEEFKLQWVAGELEAIPDDEKAIIFTGYNDTLDQVAAVCEERKIGCIKALVAGATQKQRHGYMTSFRDDESMRVYAGTMLGNSTGLNLQRGNHSYMLTLPWTAATLYQAEDREHRIGQTRPVHVNIPLVMGTIDEGIYELVVYKAALSDSVLSPEEQEKQNEAAILKLLERPARLSLN